MVRGPTTTDVRDQPGEPAASGPTAIEHERPDRPLGARAATTDGPGDALLRLWDRIVRLPAWLLLAWVAALVVLRGGASWGSYGEMVTFARNFPHPGETFRSNAVLGPLLAWATGMDTRVRWLALHATSTVGWFVAAAWLLRRSVGDATRWRAAVVWLSFTAVPTSLLRHVGAYDVHTFWGALLVALGGSPWTVLAGGALMGATNAEQGVLALVCGALVSWALPDAEGRRPDLRSTVRRFMPALVGLVAARVAVLAWFGQLGATVQGRSDAFGYLWRDSLSNAVSLGGTGAYSWLGAGWVLVLVALWLLRRQPVRWLAAAVGLVAVPATATIVTLDGSRVFCLVSSVAVLVTLVRLVPRIDRPDGRWMRSGAAALLAFGLLLPALNTTYLGGIRIPWSFFTT